MYKIYILAQCCTEVPVMQMFMIILLYNTYIYNMYIYIYIIFVRGSSDVLGLREL